MNSRRAESCSKVISTLQSLKTIPDITAVHDFFQPQPIKNAGVFFLRAVAHNWADGPFITMLKHLRSVATPDTRLVIVDWILPYACANTAAEDIPGTVTAKPAPAPLLPSYGYLNIMCFQHDVMVSSPTRLSIWPKLGCSRCSVADDGYRQCDGAHV